MNQKIINSIFQPQFSIINVVKEYDRPQATSIKYIRERKNLTLIIPPAFHECSDKITEIACKGIFDKIFDTDMLSYDEEEYIREWAKLVVS